MLYSSQKEALFAYINREEGAGAFVVGKKMDTFMEKKIFPLHCEESKKRYASQVKSLMKLGKMKMVKRIITESLSQ